MGRAPQFVINLGLMAALYAVAFTVANLVGRVLVRMNNKGIEVMNSL